MPKQRIKSEIIFAFGLSDFGALHRYKFYVAELHRAIFAWDVVSNKFPIWLVRVKDAMLGANRAVWPCHISDL
jgi:hypothetical protein